MLSSQLVAMWHDENQKTLLIKSLYEMLIKNIKKSKIFHTAAEHNNNIVARRLFTLINGEIFSSKNSSIKHCANGSGQIGPRARLSLSLVATSSELQNIKNRPTLSSTRNTTTTINQQIKYLIHFSAYFSLLLVTITNVIKSLDMSRNNLQQGQV